MLLLAQTAFAENYTFKEGVNEVMSAVSLNATYRIKTAGMTVIESDDILTVTHKNTKVSYETVYSTGGYNTRYVIDGKVGDVVKMTHDFYMGTKVRITEYGNNGMQIKPVATTPRDMTVGNATGSDAFFSWITGGNVTVQFDTPVAATSASVVYGGKSYSVDEFAVSGQFIGFNVTSAMNSAYADGMQYSDPFSIRINGIADARNSSNKYGSNGTLDLNYYAPYQQGTLSRALTGGIALSEGMNAGYKFLSYYDAKGEDGIFKFVFTKPIGQVESVRLVMEGPAAIPSDKSYSETISGALRKIDGNTLTVDVRGKLRSLSNMLSISSTDEAAAAGPHSISLVISNVKDTNGNFMHSSGQGTVGSYTFSFPYQEIQDDIAMDGDASGQWNEMSVINGGDYVQLWINKELKSIDGAKVIFKVDNGEPINEETGEPVYSLATIDIPAYAITIISHDPVDGTVIGFTMPELKGMALQGGEVTEPVMQEYEAVPGELYRLILMVTTTNGIPHEPEIKYYCQSATGITAPSPMSVPQSAIFYNIAGQRVSATHKGILISNGKKMLNK